MKYFGSLPQSYNDAERSLWGRGSLRSTCHTTTLPALFLYVSILHCMTLWIITGSQRKLHLGRLDVRRADVQARLVDVYTWRFTKDVWCMLLISPVAKECNDNGYLCHLCQFLLPHECFKSEVSSGPSRRFGASLFRNIAHHNKDIPCLGHPPTVEGTTWYSPPRRHFFAVIRWGWALRPVQYLPKAMLESCRSHPLAVALATLRETSVHGTWRAEKYWRWCRIRLDPFFRKACNVRPGLLGGLSFYPFYQTHTARLPQLVGKGTIKASKKKMQRPKFHLWSRRSTRCAGWQPPKQHRLGIALMAVIKTGTCPRMVDWSSFKAAFIHAWRCSFNEPHCLPTMLQNWDVQL